MAGNVARARQGEGPGWNARVYATHTVSAGRPSLVALAIDATHAVTHLHLDVVVPLVT
jgi:hypothetical protein